MKKTLIALATAAAVFSPLAAQAEKIGVTMFDYNDTFRSLLREGVDAAARKAGASVQFEDAKQDVGTQLNQIQNFISQKVDAIIVQAVDTDATPKITQLAAKAKIPLIYINARPSDFDKLPAGVAVVASDEIFGGTVQAQAVCKQLGGKGNALVLMGNLIHEAARLRTQAVENAFKTDKACSGMKLVDKREGKWSRTDAQDITTNWLTAGVKFDTIIANNDEMALGAINALKAAKKLDAKVVVAGIDATRDAMASMKAGELKVTVFQNAAAQGAGSVDAALKLVKGQKVDKFVNIPFELVTPENMAQYATKN